MEVSLHQDGHWWPHILHFTRFPAPFQGAELLLQAETVKPLSEEGMSLPPLLWGKQTGKPVSSQSPHQAVSPKRPDRTADCLLPLIHLLVNFLHTTLHLSVPLGTAAETFHQDAEPSLCV